MAAPVFDTFEEFFPYYLAEHSLPITRGLHYIGTIAATSLLVISLTIGPLWLFWLYIVVGYGMAWIGHYIFEKNRPATFDYMIWSLMGDYKMFALFITGRLGPQLENANRLFPRDAYTQVSKEAEVSQSSSKTV